MNSEKKKKEREDRWDVIVIVPEWARKYSERCHLNAAWRENREFERFRRVPRSTEAIHHCSTRSCTVNSVGLDKGTEALSYRTKSWNLRTNWHQTDQSCDDKTKKLLVIGSPFWSFLFFRWFFPELLSRWHPMIGAFFDMMSRNERNINDSKYARQIIQSNPWQNRAHMLWFQTWNTPQRPDSIFQVSRKRA